MDAPPADGLSANPARNYERHFVPAIAMPLARELVEFADLRPGERALDLACGTGVVTRLAAREVGETGRVTALDVNGAMLEVARAAPSTGAPIEWREAPAEDTGLPDAAYDVALCQMGLQFFADKASALDEMRRVLAPAGRVALNVPGPPPEAFAVLEAALGEQLPPDAAAFVATVFSLHEPDELERLLVDAGFVDVEVTRRSWTLRLPPPAVFLWQYAASTPLAPAVAGLDESRRAALEERVVPEWERFTDGQALVLEVGLSLASGRAAPA